MYPNLKLQIWKSGIHQNRLARMLGIDETLLSRIINGFREPNQQLRAKIAASLHSDEAWLFEAAELDTRPPDAAQGGAVGRTGDR
jgi:transcriptional regulator with XRE-family HTH domain